MSFPISLRWTACVALWGSKI